MLKCCAVMRSFAFSRTAALSSSGATCFRAAWSTAYQAVDYAKAWYRCYSDLYSPLLIRGFSPEQNLAGILALAVSQDGRLLPMGTCHAEYAAWLSGPEKTTEFVLR